MFTCKFTDGVLLGFDGVNEAPFLAQPTWPDGTPWASMKQAKDWFAVLVQSFNDPTASLAGDNPDNHPIPRPEAI